MGINGLLQQLKSVSRATHVNSYKGLKVAIDGYSWLHKGAYSCSLELCEGRWTDGFVRYFVSRIDMLLSCGVEPLVVFDGCRLPMKADEEDTRRKSRREALERAQAHAAAGNMAAAVEFYQRAVSIAPWMAKVVMEALRERGVRCVFAPYEADAQMAALAIRNHVAVVLTEDSDMLAYGCPRVLFKLDKSGHGEEVLLSDLPLAKEINLAGFTHDMVTQMCILAGCDFLPNLPGLGIKKAHALMRKYRDFVKVLRALRFTGLAIPPGYEARFQRTIWVFRHQRVFCPEARRLEHLRPLPQGGLGAADIAVLAALPPEGPEREALDFLGPPLESQIAAGIADGELDPSTLQPYDLPSIYAGCPHPPQHLLSRLPPRAAGPSGGSGSQGGPLRAHGHQRRNSWPGVGPPGGSQQQGHGAGGRPAPPPDPKVISITAFFPRAPAPGVPASQPAVQKPPRPAGTVEGRLQQLLGRPAPAGRQAEAPGREAVDLATGDNADGSQAGDAEAFERRSPKRQRTEPSGAAGGGGTLQPRASSGGSLFAHFARGESASQGEGLMETGATPAIQGGQSTCTGLPPRPRSTAAPRGSWGTNPALMRRSGGGSAAAADDAGAGSQGDFSDLGRGDLGQDDSLGRSAMSGMVDDSQMTQGAEAHLGRGPCLGANRGQPARLSAAHLLLEGALESNSALWWGQSSQDTPAPPQQHQQDAGGGGGGRPPSAPRLAGGRPVSALASLGARRSVDEAPSLGLPPDSPALFGMLQDPTAAGAGSQADGNPLQGVCSSPAALGRGLTGEQWRRRQAGRRAAPAEGDEGGEAEDRQGLLYLMAAGSEGGSGRASDGGSDYEEEVTSPLRAGRRCARRRQPPPQRTPTRARASRRLPAQLDLLESSPGNAGVEELFAGSSACAGALAAGGSPEQQLFMYDASDAGVMLHLQGGETLSAQAHARPVTGCMALRQLLERGRDSPGQQQQLDSAPGAGGSSGTCGGGTASGEEEAEGYAGAEALLLGGGQAAHGVVTRLRRPNCRPDGYEAPQHQRPCTFAGAEATGDGGYTALGCSSLAREGLRPPLEVAHTGAMAGADDDDVVIVEPPDASEPADFHSVRHVQRYAELSRRVVQKLESATAAPRRAPGGAAPTGLRAFECGRQGAAAAGITRRPSAFVDGGGMGVSSAGDAEHPGGATQTGAGRGGSSSRAAVWQARSEASLRKPFTQPRAVAAAGAAAGGGSKRAAGRTASSEQMQITDFSKFAFGK